MRRTAIAAELAAVKAERDAANRRADVAEAALAKARELADCVTELLEVADLRGDTQLPEPCDDPLLWTSRMQFAWDETRRFHDEYFDAIGGDHV